MAFIRTEHLEVKIKVREIPRDYPELILTQSRRRFKNTLKGRDIFVANLHYYGKMRPIALITEHKGMDIWLLTIFTISEKEIVSRIKNRRWIPQ